MIVKPAPATPSALLPPVWPPILSWPRAANISPIPLPCYSTKNGSPIAKAKLSDSGPKTPGAYPYICTFLTLDHHERRDGREVIYFTNCGRRSFVQHYVASLVEMESVL